MLKIEEINKFPRNFTEEICPLALKEFHEHGLMSFATAVNSDKAWRITNGDVLMYAGVIRRSILSKPEFWLMLGKNYRRNLLSSYKATKELDKKLRELYPRLIARTRKDIPEALRFAQRFGFVPVRESDKYIWLEN